MFAGACNSCVCTTLIAGFTDSELRFQGDGLGEIQCRLGEAMTRSPGGSSAVGGCRIAVVEGFRACGVRRLIYRYHPNAASRIASVFWRMMRVFSMHWLTREGTQYSGFFQPGHWFSLPKNPG
jgi:hypothetical protein